MDNITKNIILTPMNLLYKISPRLCLQILFRLKTGYKLNLDNPTTYNEKLQWIKLYDRNELMPICCDKYTVRQYVEDCGCGDILNDLLWQGFKPEDIPFDALPKQFVIKVTHGSKLNIICTNKNELDYKKTIKKLRKWLKFRYLPCYGEWFYGVVKPRIIIERFLSEDSTSIPADYKMFYFNNIDNLGAGIGFTVVDIDRFTYHKRKIYDINWNELANVRITFPQDGDKGIKRPSRYSKMIEYTIKLSTPFPHARVDFYVINEKVYFGEITFTNGAGYGKIMPNSFNEKMGSWVKLPIAGV